MRDYNVFCPYCGSKMQHTEPHIHTTRSGIGVLLQCHFYCPECKSGSPWVDGNFKTDEECIDAAYKAATTRIKIEISGRTGERKLCKNMKWGVPAFEK